MKSRWIMTAMTTAFLLGCGSTGKSYRPDEMVPDYAWYNADTKKISLSALETQFPCIYKKSNAITPPCTRLDRDQATYSLITVSDHLCNVHLSNIVSNSNAWNVSAGTITNLLAGLASIGSNSASQARLAAGAAFSNGTRSLVNNEIYAQSLATTIVRAIEIKRTSMGKDIADKLKTNDETAYPFFAAISDVEKYHNSCSFYVGVSEITRLVETRQDSIQDIKSRIQTLKEQKANNHANANAVIEAEIELLIKQLAHAQQ
jgi:hypothetical protein